MITKELIARINELSRKKRSSGLSEQHVTHVKEVAFSLRPSHKLH